MKLYLYLLEQDVNQDYDTYDSCVVVATSEEAARKMHPQGSPPDDDGGWDRFGTWAEEPSQVRVTLLGETCDDLEFEYGVVCVSFNAERWTRG